MKNKKWEIVITVVVMLAVAILVSARLFVLNKNSAPYVPVIPVEKTLSENDKLEVLKKLNKDSRDLSISEKQKILNALVGAKK